MRRQVARLLARHDLAALHGFLEKLIVCFARASQLNQLPPGWRAPRAGRGTMWLEKWRQAYPQVYTDFTGS